MDNGRLTQLMQRYNELGRLLNDEPDFNDATEVDGGQRRARCRDYRGLGCLKRMGCLARK
jgi:hypothetical protein